MASQLEIQKRNLESSLLFMQQEHSNTLRDLHQEISKLQKKCSELTFQLAMQSPSDDYEEKVQKIEELKELLAKSDRKREDIGRESDLKDATIKRMQEEFKIKERKFSHDMKKRNQQVLTLKSHLDDKSGTVAYLTTEIHKLKVLHHSQEGSLRRQSPPSELKPTSGDSRNRHKPSSGDISKRPIISTRNAAEVDAEPFLAPAPTDVQEVKVKPSPPVLPPIACEESVGKKLSTRRHHLVRKKVERSPPEYSTLAVDQIANQQGTQALKPPTTSE